VFPSGIAACQEWMTKEMDARAEDARQFMSDGQKLIDTSARLLTNGWTSTGT